MHADLEFADSCHADISVILGVRLEAFKVGHKLLLQRLRSPFVVGGDGNAPELVQAVWICSRSYADAVRGLYRASFSERLSARLFSWATAWRAGDESFIQQQADAFTAYIAKAEKDVRNVSVKEGVPRTHAPLIPLLIEDLCEAYNYTPEQVLELPFKKASFLRMQLLVKPESGLNWRANYLPPLPDEEEVSHVE